MLRKLYRTEDPLWHGSASELSPVSRPGLVFALSDSWRVSCSTARSPLGRLETRLVVCCCALLNGGLTAYLFIWDFPPLEVSEDVLFERDRRRHVLLLLVGDLSMFMG